MWRQSASDRCQRWQELFAPYPCWRRKGKLPSDIPRGTPCSISCEHVQYVSNTAQRAPPQQLTQQNQQTEVGDLRHKISIKSAVGSQYAMLLVMAVGRPKTCLGQPILAGHGQWCVRRQIVGLWGDVIAQARSTLGTSTGPPIVDYHCLAGSSPHARKFERSEGHVPDLLPECVRPLPPWLMSASHSTVYRSNHDECSFDPTLCGAARVSTG